MAQYQEGAVYKSVFKIQCLNNCYNTVDTKKIKDNLMLIIDKEMNSLNERSRQFDQRSRQFDDAKSLRERHFNLQEDNVKRQLEEKIFNRSFT